MTIYRQNYVLFGNIFYNFFFEKSLLGNKVHDDHRCQMVWHIRQHGITKCLYFSRELTSMRMTMIIIKKIMSYLATMHQTNVPLSCRIFMVKVHGDHYCQNDVIFGNIVSLNANIFQRIFTTEVHDGHFRHSEKKFGNSASQRCSYYWDSLWYLITIVNKFPYLATLKIILVRFIVHCNHWSQMSKKYHIWQHGII